MSALKKNRSEDLSIFKQQNQLNEIVHEIKNPLNIILNASELLLEQVEAQNYSPAFFQESLIRIRNTTRRISQIISTQQKAAAENKLNFQSVDLASLILEITDLFKHSMQHQKIIFSHNLDLNRFFVLANPIQLGQVFTNLFVNSIDALKDSLRKQIEIRVISQGSNYQIDFSDTGSGISVENQTKVMEKFFTTKSTGNGIGLHLSKDIIAQHSGSMKITHFQNPTTVSIALKKHIEE